MQGDSVKVIQILPQWWGCGCISLSLLSFYTFPIVNMYYNQSGGKINFIFKKIEAPMLPVAFQNNTGPLTGMRFFPPQPLPPPQAPSLLATLSSFIFPAPALHPPPQCFYTHPWALASLSRWKAGSVRAPQVFVNEINRKAQKIYWQVASSLTFSLATSLCRPPLPHQELPVHTSIFTGHKTYLVEQNVSMLYFSYFFTTLAAGMPDKQ